MSRDQSEPAYLNTGAGREAASLGPAYEVFHSYMPTPLSVYILRGQKQMNTRCRTVSPTQDQQPAITTQHTPRPAISSHTLPPQI